MDELAPAATIICPSGGSVSFAAESDQSSDLNPQVSDLKSQPSHKSYEELITFVTDRPGHDLRYAIDSTKIRDELSWEPKEDFESGFRKTVNWYLSNPGWWQSILEEPYQLERLGKS